MCILLYSVGCLFWILDLLGVVFVILVGVYLDWLFTLLFGLFFCWVVLSLFRFCYLVWLLRCWDVCFVVGLFVFAFWVLIILVVGVFGLIICTFIWLLCCDGFGYFGLVCLVILVGCWLVCCCTVCFVLDCSWCFYVRLVGVWLFVCCFVISSLRGFCFICWSVVECG